MGLETLALVGLALSAAGTGAGMAASAEEAGAMNDKVQAELERQKKFQKKATPVFEKSLGESGAPTMQANVASGQQRLAEEYARLAAVPLTANDPLGSNAPIPLNPSAAAGTRMAENLAATTGARAGGWNESSLQQSIKDILTNSQLGVIGQQAKISAAPLPYEIQQAGQSWDWLKALGMAGQSAGGLAGMYGMLKSPSTPQPNPTGGWWNTGSS